MRLILFDIIQDQLQMYYIVQLLQIFCHFSSQIMPLKNEMKKPKNFGSFFGVLNASMLPISLLYAIIGFFGYLKFGDTTKGSITLNLPPNDV